MHLARGNSACWIGIATGVAVEGQKGRSLMGARARPQCQGRCVNRGGSLGCVVTASIPLALVGCVDEPEAHVYGDRCSVLTWSDYDSLVPAAEPAAYYALAGNAIDQVGCRNGTVHGTLGSTALPNGDGAPTSTGLAPDTSKSPMPTCSVYRRPGSSPSRRGCALMSSPSRSTRAPATSTGWRRGATISTVGVSHVQPRHHR